ncbi:MAG: MMPL family transporter [Pseudoalteromonas sp.]|uniref:MMPL family transporter n=1 Tax=unclassified Pseudoalteromonas TaxID=194690 RepID=UPI003F94D250
MPLSSRAKLFLWCAQLLALLAGLSYLWLFKSFSIIADINQIFKVEQDTETRLVTEQVEQRQLRQHVLLVGHQDRTTAIKYADKAAQTLESINGINVKVHFDSLPKLGSIVGDYLDYQHAFISPQYQQLLKTKNTDEIFKYQFSLLNEIGSPWVSATLEADKSLALADYFNQQTLPTSNLKNHNGYLVAEYNNKAGQHMQYVLVNFISNGTGLDLNVAKKIADKVTELKHNSFQEGAGIDYLATGAAFFTANASASAESEMALFGGISVIATLLLILMIYRSALSVICTLFVISISMLYGYTALRLFFTEVNILTLVFAVTLIGIAADYSFHALSELRFSRVDKVNPLKNIRSSLLLGFVTTTAGYFILALTPLALFKQIAVFTMAGLLGALLTVLLVYPSLAALIIKKPSTMPSFIKTLNQYQQLFMKKRLSAKWQVGFVAILLAGLSLVNNVDDPRQFYQTSDDLIAQQHQITEVLNTEWDSPYLLVSGQSEQQVLENMEQLLPKLEQLIKTNTIEAYSSISQWLPSLSAQKYSQKIISNAQDNGLFEQLNAVLGGAQSNSHQTDYKQINFSMWQKTKVAPLFTNQWLQVNNRFYSIIKLQNITNTASLKSISNDYKEVVFVDKVAEVSEQIGQFRQHLTFIYILALAAAMLVFWLRYGFVSASIAISRPIIAIVVALALSAGFFGSLTVFNYVAGILILALGLDYCVFYAEHGNCKKITLTTLVSALSSLFVFAILIASSTPAVRQFGFTVFIGVVVVFIVAPRLTLVSKRNIS